VKPPRPTTGKRKQEPDRPIHDGVTEVYYEVRGDQVVSWPILNDKSDAKVIEEAGALLWLRAGQKPDDSLLVGAARVMRALWLMIRVRDVRACNAMLALEKLCIEYRAARYADVEKETNPDEQRKLDRGGRWPSTELPSRARLDRHRNLGTLLELTELFQGMRVRTNPEPPEVERVILAAKLFIEAVAKLLPHIAAAPRDAARKRTIAAAWLRRAHRGHRQVSELDPELMLVDGLVAFGVPRGRVHNWLKGVPRDRPPRDQSQTRDGHGRYVRKQPTP
jgi:hypothetical protein